MFSSARGETARAGQSSCMRALSQQAEDPASKNPSGDGQRLKCGARRCEMTPLLTKTKNAKVYHNQVGNRTYANRLVAASSCRQLSDCSMGT